MQEKSKLHAFESHTLRNLIGINFPEREEIDQAISDGIRHYSIEDYIKIVGVLALLPAQRMLSRLPEWQKEELVFEVYDYVIAQRPELAPRLEVINGSTELSEV